MAKKKIEYFSITYRRDENLYQHKITTYMNAFLQFVCEPLKLTNQKEYEETYTS
jgi:hypothetical protein